jgi:hypothetical protein
MPDPGCPAIHLDGQASGIIGIDCSILGGNVQRQRCIHALIRRQRHDSIICTVSHYSSRAPRFELSEFLVSLLENSHGRVMVDFW